MTTTIYFVRHAEPNYNNHDDLSRELTKKGLQDCQYLNSYFSDKHIDYFYSSPYLRAIQTIENLALHHKQKITLVDDFRERKISDTWIENFDDFTKKQWSDLNYRLDNGESLSQVIDRQLTILKNLINKHKNQSLVIGSHGTAISALIHHYQTNFAYMQFKTYKNLFPFIAKFEFDADTCRSITIDNIFTGEHDDIYSI